ncbi:uncharacterized protein LOC120710620 [Panicum virgatum]|uniref:Uncharacterized protein n=1 Tax=Panicum virgatum TaxID=38727 RepID=A0A8T0SM73_PANVG|nr:uncharacterized protein LOC120710620 [Panicum virgatum]KAG2598107.1 hypothetical protein PVAP13_5KG300414 [Panicum virgatum]KAG2598108.1 hypothetical protein PVAP13_5KG300414 [Panicum virgatum]KAG2598109.1 hypothetical protein PVAP13_5KG300414 [Panicum virgatum]
MAGRVLLRAAALGLAAAGALHAVSKWTPPREISPYVPSMRFMLLESAQDLQAALLGAHPLYGQHLRDVRARADHDLALADVDRAEGGDPAAAADLRLLAFLATRDVRADDALRIYEEAARDAPFDPRPRALAYHLCCFDRRHDESVRWSAAYRRLVPVIDGASQVPGLESHEMRELVRELFIAATMGGVFRILHPGDRAAVMDAACGAVDKGLVAALQDKELSATERLRLRALRVYLHAKVLLLIKEARDVANGGAEASPVS